MDDDRDMTPDDQGAPVDGSASATLPPGDNQSLWPVLLIALLALAARVVYLRWFCGYDLIEDEAQYWLWSKHLDWSYYTKGPGVAWAIWLSGQFFGETEWAVRLPSAVCSAIGALAAGALARNLAIDAWTRAGEGVRSWATPARVGGAAALAYSIVPVLQGAGILMTIDAPYVACWAVACWAFHRAIKDSAPGPGVAPRFTEEHSEGGEDAAWRGSAWVVVGAAVAIGFLFKYTMLLLVPGLVLYLALTQRERGALLASRAARAWFAAGLAIAIAGLAPVVYWNQINGWPTLAHLLGHLGVRGGDVPVSSTGSSWSPVWLPELVAQQLAMVGPWIVLGCGVAWKTFSGRDAGDERRPGRLLLACAAAPILVFYTIVALIAEPEGNWPMAAYATLVPLAAWAGVDAIAARRTGLRTGEGKRERALVWRVGIWYAVIAALLIHKWDWIGDAGLALNRQAWFRQAFTSVTGHEPVDRDIAGRIRGAKDMARHVQELVRGLETERGVEAFVIAQHYGRASQLSYYLKPREAPSTPRLTESGDRAGPGLSRVDRPRVVCAMVQTGGRRSQFDMWAHTRLDQDWLMGRPAVIVTSTRPEVLAVWQRMFERIEPIPGGRLRGEGKADRSAYLGYGYRGPKGRTESSSSPATSSSSMEAH